MAGIPYAPGRVYDSPHTRSIADLIRYRGERRADKIRRAGEINAQMWSNIGNIAGQAIGSYMDAKEQDRQEQINAPRIAMEDEARSLQLANLRDARTAGQRASADQDTIRKIASSYMVDTPDGFKTYDRSRIMGELAQGGRGDLVDELNAHIAEWDKSIQASRQARTEALARSAAMIHATGNRPEGFKMAIAGLVANHELTEQQGNEYISQVGEDATKIAALTRAFMAQSKATEGLIPKEPEPFTLGPDQVRYGGDGHELARGIPKPPDQPKAGTFEAFVTDEQKRIGRALAPPEVLALKSRWDATGRAPANDNEPLVPIIGPDGKAVYGTRAEARGKQIPSGSARPASGLERRTLAFFNRAQQADADLERLEPEIKKLGLGGQMWMENAPNFAQSETGQQYTQAQRAFTEARLRKDSGAAIPDAEYTNDRKTYFPQPGDSADTLAQKQRARAAVLASLSFESGQALAEYVGSREEADSLISGFKARSARSEGLMVRIKAPNGEMFDIPQSELQKALKAGAQVVK